MGNKPVPGQQYNPERSLSWQPPEPPPSGGHQVPGRRNSFATVIDHNSPSSVAPPSGRSTSAPRHYAASEMGGTRYQKRPIPSDSNSKLGNKANSLKNKQQQYYSSTLSKSNKGFEHGPPPPPFFPPYYGPIAPGPVGVPIPYAYGPPPPPPPHIFGPPPPPLPMDPAIMMGIGPPANDSKRMKKIKQKQQKQYNNVGRHYSTMSTLSEIPPPMFAIMPPPPPAPPLSIMNHPHAYQPTIHRAKSVDNVNAYAKNGGRPLKLYSPTDSAQNGGTLSKDGPHRSISHLDVPTNIRKGKSHRHHDDNRQMDEIVAKSVKNANRQMDKIEPDILYSTEDGLTASNVEQSKLISDSQRSNEKNSNSNVSGNKLTYKSDVIYESLKGGEQKRGKRGSDESSPAAVNIRFGDYNDKEKYQERFMPPIAVVTLEAQTVMERNAKRLAEAEQLESQKPGSVLVNEEPRQNYEDENDIDEKLIASTLPSRKLEAEIFEQRTLQRQPVHRLKKDADLPELVLTSVPKKTLPNDSPASSSKSSVSKSCLKKPKVAPSSEDCVEAVLNPVLAKQKSKKFNEFRPTSAWNDIDVSSSSEAFNRRRHENGSEASQQARWQQGAVDERIVVHLLPMPPAKQQTGQQEPIYLDQNEKRLPEFKKRLIETGSFDFAEFDNNNYNNYDRRQSASSRGSSRNGDEMPTTKNMQKSETLKNNNNWNRANWMTQEEDVVVNKAEPRRQRYSFDNRSKSNVGVDQDRSASYMMTPSETKIKASDCSDIDFSWVDDLETRFRVEREQFERQLQNIKEKTLQNGIKCLHADETIRANGIGYHSDNLPLKTTNQHRNNSLSTDEPSSLMDSSLTNSPKENYKIQSHNDKSAFNATTSTSAHNNYSRFDSRDFDSKAVTRNNEGSNFLRDYSSPNGKPSSHLLEDVNDRPVAANNYVRARAATFENELQKQTAVNPSYFGYANHSNNRRVIEENNNEEPIYIPKPDYEQMENDFPIGQSYENGSFNNHHHQPKPKYAADPRFERSLTVQTNQNHENTSRAYPSPSPRSPSQRKLNRYYANSHTNGNGNNVSFESEWVEAPPVTQQRRQSSASTRKDRYNVQLGGSYSVNPNITTDFKQFDSYDPAGAPYFPQYNGRQETTSYQDYHEDQKFVEKMNEMNGVKGDNQKWFRNPSRQQQQQQQQQHQQQFQRSNHINDNGNGDAHSDIYISRPNLTNNGRYNFARSHQMYGSSHY